MKWLLIAAWVFWILFALWWTWWGVARGCHRGKGHIWRAHWGWMEQQMVETCAECGKTRRMGE